MTRERRKVQPVVDVARRDHTGTWTVATKGFIDGEFGGRFREDRFRFDRGLDADWRAGE